MPLLRNTNLYRRFAKEAGPPTPSGNAQPIAMILHTAPARSGIALNITATQQKQSCRGMRMFVEAPTRLAVVWSKRHRGRVLLRHSASTGLSADAKSAPVEPEGRLCRL